MIDEIAIQQILNLYSEGSGRLDKEQMMDTFTPDGVWEVPALGVHCKGQDQMWPVMQGVVSGFSYFSQINAPAVIKITGDAANARSPVRESGKYSDRDETLEVYGYYDDALVRTPEGWRFTRRTFHLTGMHTAPAKAVNLGGA